MNVLCLYVCGMYITIAVNFVSSLTVVDLYTELYTLTCVGCDGLGFVIAIQWQLTVCIINGIVLYMFKCRRRGEGGGWRQALIPVLFPHS